MAWLMYLISDLISEGCIYIPLCWRVLFRLLFLVTPFLSGCRTRPVLWVSATWLGCFTSSSGAWDWPCWWPWWSSVTSPEPSPGEWRCPSAILSPLTSCHWVPVTCSAEGTTRWRCREQLIIPRCSGAVRKLLRKYAKGREVLRCRVQYPGSKRGKTKTIVRI